MRRDEARQLLEDSVTRWRSDAARLGERAGESLASVARQLGLVTREEIEELELRLAQLEHRLRLLEGPRARLAGLFPPACNTERMAQPAQQRNLGRLSEIAQVAVRHGFGYFFETHKLTDLLPWPRPRGAARSGRAAPSARGQHLREMLDELGPTFVKFGQLLSTRPGHRPAGHHRRAARAPGRRQRRSRSTRSQRVIREELELPLEKLFLEFEETPMAAASIGQVHRAVLPNGQRVAVKVQRPDAPRQIEADLALLYQAARLAKERVRALDFIDAHELVDEFARSIRHELDYRQEGAQRADVPPELRRPPARPRPARLLELLAAARADARAARGLAARRPRGRGVHARGAPAPRDLITEAWMTMIFRHGFFHADPHPANILVLDAGDDRPRRLRAGREAQRRRHVEADRAVHRRGLGERRRAARSGSATSASATNARARPS